MQTRLLSMVALVALLFAVPAVFFVCKYRQSFYIYFPLVAVQHFIGLSVKCFWITSRLFKDILRAPEKMQLHSVCQTLQKVFLLPLLQKGQRVWLQNIGACQK